jgi:hypothetical protein
MKINLTAPLLVILCGLAVPTELSAYPEYREYVVKHSGHTVNCALCHTHSDGPDGAAPGQLGGLTTEQFTRLNQARTAFEPGQITDSPILNEFGNSIIGKVGRRKFIELRQRPSEITALLDPVSDLDHDGIPDRQEFLEGTHPVNPDDGNPWILFKINFQRGLPQIVLTMAATLAGLYGLIHLLHGFAAISLASEKEGSARRADHDSDEI